ncbi:MAG: DUF2752 domain-containing protein [Bacteroidota bacterium]
MLATFISLQIFCSRLLFISWLQNHLIPCPFKYLTGIDCPGCGFQRAIIALFQGQWQNSYLLYPPTIPLLLFFMYGIADAFFKLDNDKGTLKKSLFIPVAAIVLISYSIKIWGVYHGYTASVAAAM